MRLATHVTHWDLAATVAARVSVVLKAATQAVCSDKVTEATVPNAIEIRVELQSEYRRHKRLCERPR